MSVHSTQHRGNHWTISYNASRLTLSREWGGGNDVFNYDLEGRPWNIFLEGVSYQRGLDNAFIAKWIDDQGERQRRSLQSSECDEMIKLAASTASDFLGLMIEKQEAPAFTPSPPEEAEQAVERAAAFDLNRSQLESEQFHEIYLPVGILPPDQYMAVLLQATEGCSFNQCTFCRFYESTRFRIKSSEEFRQHAEAIRDYLGQGLNLRRTVFLGDANALVVPTDRLLNHLKATLEIFPEQAQGGVHAFLDGFSGRKKSTQEYQELADYGLKRVYIGLESGHDPLLKFLNKPGSAGDAVQAVHNLKAAGISVGVIILLGAGGQYYQEGHVRDTIEVVSAMGLDLQDQIYFSELMEPPGASYAQDALNADLGELTSEALERQWREIQAGLHYWEATGTPHMARYDIREFIY